MMSSTSFTESRTFLFARPSRAHDGRNSPKVFGRRKLRRDAPRPPFHSALHARVLGPRNTGAICRLIVESRYSTTLPPSQLEEANSCHVPRGQAVTGGRFQSRPLRRRGARKGPFVFLNAAIQPNPPKPEAAAAAGRTPRGTMGDAPWRLKAPRSYLVATIRSIAARFSLPSALYCARDKDSVVGQEVPWARPRYPRPVC
jgi:hypothetical protein